MRERKSCLNGPGHMTKYMVSSSPEPEGLLCSIRNVGLPTLFKGWS